MLPTATDERGGCAAVMTDSASVRPAAPTAAWDSGASGKDGDDDLATLREREWGGAADEVLADVEAKEALERKELGDRSFRDLRPATGYRVADDPIERGHSALPHFLDLVGKAVVAEKAAEKAAVDGHVRGGTVDMSTDEANSAERTHVYAALSFNELREISPAVRGDQNGGREGEEDVCVCVYVCV